MALGNEGLGDNTPYRIYESDPNGIPILPVDYDQSPDLWLSRQAYGSRHAMSLEQRGTDDDYLEVRISHRELEVNEVDTEALKASGVIDLLIEQDKEDYEDVTGEQLIILGNILAGVHWTEDGVYPYIALYYDVPGREATSGEILIYKGYPDELTTEQRRLIERLADAKIHQ